MRTARLSAVLLVALALGSCGRTRSQTEVAPQPALSTSTTLKSLGLYELRVNALGTSHAQAMVTRAGLSAQATEIQGLTFVPHNMVNLRDPAQHVNHMTASFTVTNNTGTTIIVPTFVPVDTDGAYATDGETPFRSVTTRTGAPASAAGMQIEQSYHTNGASIEVDPSATPLVGNLDTGALELNLPAGTTAPGVSHQGWQSATLAPGASVVVNFAASVPMPGTDIGDSDPFSFSLVFAVTDSPAKANLTPIASVQGQTPAADVASPLSGQTVTVEGIVTSVLPGLSGFFVQEEGIDADRDAATSEGIFVYCASNCPSLSAGTRVKVAGTVAEFGGSTQLTSPSVSVVASGVIAPKAISLTLPFDKAQQERYEGMRVTFPETLTVTNNYTYGRYGQLDLSNNGRVFNPTNGNAKTGQSTVTLDDGISAQNPANLNYLSNENTRRTGDTVTGLSGIWHSVANLPMIEPAGAVDFVSVNARTANAQPHDVGGTLKVGGANVLNYFTTYGSSTDRGANNATELQRQRTKMASNLVTLNADVLTLMEVQNNGDTALSDLVAALNEKAGAGTYAAVKTGAVGTDAIKVAIIYKPAKVTPVGAYMTDTNSVFSRPPVAQTFRDNATGGVFSVVANHFKSKGSCNASDPDLGQGCWNNLRVQQSTQLLNFVKTIQQQSGDQDVLLLGDFNAYGAEDPIKTLQGGGFESLNLRIPAEDRYSYQFGGQFGYLDHALSSGSLSAQVTGITEWHVNSDEPTIADYNIEYKKTTGCTATNCTGIDLFDPASPFRASDHDPVLVGLNLTTDGGPVNPGPVNPATPVTSLSANPAALTVTAGGAAVNTTLTTSTQNYSGADLTISTQSGAGLSVTPSVTTVSPNGTFTVSVRAPIGTAAGTYPVTVTTTGEGGLSASTTLNVTVGVGGAVTPVSGHLVISEVYGGGGNTGATYTHDFIEIFNPTNATINLSGYSVQYASATGTSWNLTPLTNVNLAPGQYYLVQQAKGTGGTTPLPTPDASGTIAMAGASGQVALVEGTTKITSSTDAAVRDYVKYSASNTTSARRVSPCVDTDAASDFTTGPADPQNTASPLTTCQ